MSNINMENLAITKLCLEEILDDRYELEGLLDSVCYELDLNIRSLKNVIEIIDNKLENYR